MDRESWIKTLNSASRGERKQKELGAGLISEPTEHKGSVSGLKTAQSNRPRTGSVLAGMYVELATLSIIHSENRTTCSGLLKTGLNNVLMPTLFNVVNNLFSIVTPDRRLIQAQQC